MRGRVRLPSRDARAHTPAVPDPCALVPGGVHPFFQLLDLSTWEASQISSGHNIHGSYFPMVRRVASLGLIADSWYSVAHDLPWSWCWEWVSVTRASIQSFCLMRLQLAPPSMVHIHENSTTHRPGTVLVLYCTARLRSLHVLSVLCMYVLAMP